MHGNMHWSTLTAVLVPIGFALIVGALRGFGASYDSRLKSGPERRLLYRRLAVGAGVVGIALVIIGFTAP